MMVRILALVLFISGVVVVVVGITISTGNSWMSDLMPSDPTDPEQADAVALAEAANGLGTVFEGLIYFFGVYTVQQALMAGCCCSKMPKDKDTKCCSLNGCRGLCLCVLFFQIQQIGLLIATIIIAIMPMVFYSIPTEDVEWFCTETRDSMNDYFVAESLTEEWYVEILDQAKEVIDTVDGTINIRSDLMCREPCCCDIGDKTWADWGTDFITTDLCVGDITNWESCAAEYDALTQPSENDNDEDANAQRAEEAVATYLDSLLKTLEEEFDCQGICSSGDFYLFKEVSAGKPTSGCLVALKEEFSSASFAAMIVLFIVAAIDLLIFICMFAMFTSKKD